VSEQPRRTILVATDSDAVLEDLEAALSEPGTTLARVHSGQEVLAAVHEVQPDLVVLDLQIGNMGGVDVVVDPIRIRRHQDRCHDEPG